MRHSNRDVLTYFLMSVGKSLARDPFYHFVKKLFNYDDISETHKEEYIRFSRDRE